MSSLSYLVSRKIKNRLRVAIHRPSEIIVFLLFASLIVFTVFAGNTSDTTSPRNINELYAIVLALYSLIFVLTAKNGFVNGASMFSMADVNFLFTSPRKPEGVLTYGLFSQMGRSLTLGIFILYQYSLAHDVYGIDYSFLVYVLIGYAVTVFLSQMLSMIIYSLTSNSDRKTSSGKFIFYGSIAVFIIYLLTAYLKDRNIEAVISAANSPFMKFFPVAGFVSMGVCAINEGNVFPLIISLLCFVLYIASYFISVKLINADYYEDVLKATEISFSAITSRKEGKIPENTRKNIKTGKTGFKKGFGASALFEKHKIENRRGRIFFIDTVCLVMAGITVIFSLFTKSIFSALLFNIYISLFSVGTGRWAKELLLPYVYLIPEKPFRKLLYILKEQIPSLLAESFITSVAIYLALRCTVGDIIGFFFAKISFSVLFIAINLLFERFLGTSGNKSLIVFLYFLAALIFSIPFALVFYILAMLRGFAPVSSLMAASLVNIAVSLVMLFISRNVLEYAEFNNK